MANTHKLWNLIVTTAPALADAIAEACEDRSRALTILIPPRKNEARIEALYDFKPDLAELTSRLAVVAALYEAPQPKIEITEPPQTDWVKKVAGDFPPLPIARWTIFGAHHRHKVPRARYTLQIDATSAFGTGEHPTTRGCLEMLEWFLKRSNRAYLANPSPVLPRKGGGTHKEIAGKIFDFDANIKFSSSSCLKRSPPLTGGDRGGVLSARRKLRALDLGCGSAILAMAWAQATHGQAVAVDNDPDSVAIAKKNVRVNGLQKYIRVAESDGYNSALVHNHAPYDLILSNIFAKPLCEMAADLKEHLRPGGMVILSGLLQRQANSVIAAHKMQGLQLIRHKKIGEWSVLALRRPASAK